MSCGTLRWLGLNVWITLPCLALGSTAKVILEDQLPTSQMLQLPEHCLSWPVAGL